MLYVISRERAIQTSIEKLMLVERHVSWKMTLISRERDMCSRNSEWENCDEGIGSTRKGAGDYQIEFPKLS